MYGGIMILIAFNKEKQQKGIKDDKYINTTEKKV